MTPGCTVEACQFSENISQFTKRKAVVLGVSLDDEKKHQKFTEKYGLTFPLLADTDKTVSTAYEVYGKKKFMGMSYMGIERTTFIIDGKGKIVKIFRKVKADGHSKEVLQVLDTF
jgi:peroxiredoxin Q/BCP